MSAPVAASSGNDLLTGGLPRHLAEPVQGVILPKETDHRPSAAHGIFRDESGGDTGDPFLHFESFRLEGSLQFRGRSCLLIGQFRVSPDIPGDPDGLLRLVLYISSDLFQCAHDRYLPSLT